MSTTARLLHNALDEQDSPKTKLGALRSNHEYVNTTSDMVLDTFDGIESWEIPHSCDTGYLAHSYFRYVGKFPPQIAAKLIEDYYPGSGKILDPMVGGGTVLTEALIRNIRCEGWDINPVSILISTCVSRKVEQRALEKYGAELIEALASINGEPSLFSNTNIKNFPPLKLKFCQEYFDEATKNELAYALDYIKKIDQNRYEVAELLQMIVLSTLRRISFANVKKMNLELDLNKKTRSTLYKEFQKHFLRISEVNKHLPSSFNKGLATVKKQSAINWQTEDKYGLICIHPPYLTNTAFSESTQLQLAITSVDHKSIWQNELRCRGSFLHEPNGLKKYLVNWAKIIGKAAESLESGGRLAVVVGDGNIDYVRIPVGACTVEFGKDAGLRLVKQAIHLLNNNTGQTQNKKMRGQHVIVFEKP